MLWTLGAHGAVELAGRFLESAPHSVVFGGVCFFQAIETLFDLHPSRVDAIQFGTLAIAGVYGSAAYVTGCDEAAVCLMAGIIVSFIAVRSRTGLPGPDGATRARRRLVRNLPGWLLLALGAGLLFECVARG